MAVNQRGMGDQGGGSRLNLAGRMARRLTRAAQRDTGARQVLILLLVSVVWFLLTAWGSREFAVTQGATPLGAWLDGLYGPFTFLTPQADYVSGTQLSWQFRAGRFFGAAIPVLGIYWAVSRRACRMLARVLTARWARGHVVVIGDAPALELARATAGAGDHVVLAVDGVALPDAATDGVLVLAAGETVARTLDATGAERASRIACWSARDSDSLAYAIAARDALPAGPGEIVVRVDSSDIQRALRHAPGLIVGERGRLRPIGPQASALRLALCGDGPVREAVESRRDAVHVVLHGDTAALRIAAELVLRHNWSIHLAPPRVTLAGTQTPGWQAWCARNAFLTERGEQVFGEDCPAFRVEPEIGAIAGATRHLVDLGEDEATLAATFALAARLAQLHSDPPPVQPIVRRARGAAALVDGARLALLGPLDLDRAEPLGDLLAAEDAMRAEELHAAYRGAESVTDAAAHDWERLPETYVHANRAAADHGAVKRYDSAIALERAMDPAWTEAKLARSEHLRWCAERLLDGWAPGSRDPGRRLHPDLIPWGDLATAERHKDKVQVGVVRDPANGTGA